MNACAGADSGSRRSQFDAAVAASSTRPPSRSARTSASPARASASACARGGCARATIGTSSTSGRHETARMAQEYTAVMRLHVVDGTYELFRAHFSKRPEPETTRATIGLVHSLL